MTRPADADQLTRVRTALARRYAVEQEIGRGGMAVVYLAEDRKHRRQVAVKVLQPDIARALGPDRFLREIETVAALNHPHILPLHDSGEAGDLLFYVMPWVQGPSLRQKLQGEGPLPIDDALRITGAVAAAIGHAHLRGLVHRDIKPENILLHEGEAMVTDFGIAHAAQAAAGDRLTETGIVVGTPAYMSPEQSMASPQLDLRSDVYSLACVLYEMLAGEPPFVGASAAAIIAKRLSDPPPSVRRLRPTVPAGVERALLKALARVPADRFPSALTFAAELTTPVAVDSSARAVAVLPFLNLSADAENEYFADGVTEDVIAHLAKMPGLKVISRTSVMPFRKRAQSLQQIAATLGVTTILDGSVRRAGNRVRVVAQLIDAQSDQHLWAETYDRELVDIFAIQTDVALHIAAALRAELSSDDRARIGREPTSDIDAYQLYLQGRYCLVRYTDEGMQKAISFFERAIARDPGYALAHADIAFAFTELTESGILKPHDGLRRARRAAESAMALDGTLGQAHCMVGQVRLLTDFDWAGAEAAFKRALELSPGSADTYDFYGRMCGAVGRHDEAMAMLRRAQELDPLAHRADLATTLLRAGRYEQALESAKHAVELDPNYDRAHATLGWAWLLNDRPDEAIAALGRAESLAPRNSGWLAQLGQAFAMVGRTSEAREVLRQLEDRSRQGFVSPYHRAYVHTGLGEHDEAIDWLERAYDARSGAIYGIKESFLFVALRQHPRFIALLGRMNLSP